MNIRCENCGHAALDTDSSCWHCGEPLPGREEAGRKKIKVRESWTRGAGPGSVVIFGGLTLLVTLAALLVMSSLASQPQLQVRLGTRTPPDWTLLTAADNAFTVTLPDRWSWLDSADRQAGPQLDALIGSTPRLRLATHPLGAETDDMTILFAAGDPLPGDSQTPFLVVAASPLLNRLTYQETVDFLSSSGYDVQSVRFEDDFDKSHVGILVDTPLMDADSGDDDGETIRCRQQFVLGRKQSLLIALCAPVESYDVYNNTFDQIIASFQHLDI
ncbi:MAG: hypothetical protein PVH18_06675 [Chloroflexota bacterium]|jgi:hypothetical protein